MPRLDHRKLGALFFPSNAAPSLLQRETEDAMRRKHKLKIVLGLQTAYACFTLVFAVYETSAGSLVHERPPAELFKVLAYSFSCLAVYRSIQAYIRLMLIWTITTAFSGVYQCLSWLETSSGSDTERYLVMGLLMLSIAGMMGNIFGAVTVFPWGSSPRRDRRRAYKVQPKES